MAQPVFDAHPLGEYFREAGEAPADLMPGGAADFVPLEEDVDPSEDVELTAADFDWLPAPVIEWLQFLQPFLSTIPISFCTPNNQSRFAERFKYDVISSTLLSSTLPVPSVPVPRHNNNNLHGHLHRRTSSASSVGPISLNDDDDSLTRRRRSSSVSDVTTAESSEGWYWKDAALVLFVSWVGFAGQYMLALVLGAVAYYLIQTGTLKGKSKQDVVTASLDALSQLVTAGNEWDAVVNSAVTQLENDERSAIYTSPSHSHPPSPSSSLRIALHSSLHTTQSQCDNVRQLLSALTAPAELSQLSEMYAPSSPTISSTEQPEWGSNNIRPLSLPTSAREKEKERWEGNKRATWNGSYTSLAMAGNPPPSGISAAQMMRQRKEGRRRSDLSAVVGGPSPPPDLRRRTVLGLGLSGASWEMGSLSAPTSPQPRTPLEDVSEDREAEEEEAEGMEGKVIVINEDEEEERDEEVRREDEDEEEFFGAAALNLQRKRRSGGLEAFGIPPPPASPRSPNRRSLGAGSISSQSHRSSLSASSRFTTPSAARHPLSLSSLHLALQGALSSKRYACAHLLALRFEEEEDETYWEDVRSVMALLTSTLADASERLNDALSQAEKQKAREAAPSPGPDVSLFGEKRKKAKSMQQMLGLGLSGIGSSDGSFAPMPSHLSRFAGHVDTISTAMNDARDFLEQCVVALRHSGAAGIDTGAGTGPSSSALSSPPDPSILPAALEAYERLRRELGLALRECERGRDRLMDIMAASSPTNAASSNAEEDDMPALGIDIGSDESDKHDSLTPTVDEIRVDAPEAELITVVDPESATADDVASHLMSSQRLPPPGAEQVYESESAGGAAWNRERSKLSREERIKLSKARREKAISGASLFSGGGFRPGADESDSQPSSARESWGPGGDVVQELKDVIWKVGEKRRKMTQEGSGSGSVDMSIPPPPHRRDSLNGRTF